MRTRKGSLNVSDAVGTEAAGGPEEESGPTEGALAKDRRGERLAQCGVGVASPRPPLETPPSAGGRGHQVHKSWPSSTADSDGSLDPGPGSGEEAPACRASGAAGGGRGG